MPYSSHHTKRTYASHIPYHCWCWPWSHGQGSVGYVSPLHVCTFFLYFSVLYSLERSYYVQLTLKELGSVLPLNEDGLSIYIHYLQFFSMGNLFILLQIFIHLFIPLQIHGYLFHTLDYNPKQFYFIVQIVQHWPLEAHSFDSCVPLIYTHHYVFVWAFFFEHFITSWHYKMLQLYLVYFLPQS